MKNIKDQNRAASDIQVTGMHASEITDTFRSPGDEEEIVNEQEQNEIVNEEDEGQTTNANG